MKLYFVRKKPKEYIFSLWKKHLGDNTEYCFVTWIFEGLSTISLPFAWSGHAGLMFPGQAGLAYLLHVCSHLWSLPGLRLLPSALSSHSRGICETGIHSTFYSFFRSLSFHLPLSSPSLLFCACIKKLYIVSVYLRYLINSILYPQIPHIQSHFLV